MGDAVLFGVLGPLQVIAGNSGERSSISAPRLRVLLAVLLWRANQPVSADELAELLWDGTPPGGTAEATRALVMRLRQRLGTEAAARIVTRAPGYAVEVSAEELDASRFETLTREAGAAVRAGRWAEAAETAAGALRLWRGTPLADIPSQLLRDQWVPRLERLYLQVLDWRIAADLREGRHEQLITELQDLTARHPLREHFHGQLMLALARSGRQAEALAAYQQARRALVDELGVEPGAELRDVHRQVLAGGGAPATGGAGGDRPAVLAEGAVPGVVGAAAGPAGPAPCPAQLPAGIADFTGRQAQAASLYDALAGGATADGSGVVRVAVVAGAAGLGKTTLAVHVAHQVRGLFPDGQLYAQLSGASGRPAEPGEVLARFLRDLGADGEKIPAGEGERAALYRTLLAGRRVLVVLDDATDAAQVRPLLPGSASCAVLVTTRSRTPFLVSTVFTDLEVLPGPEAAELFSRIAGDARPAAEPEATAEVLAACAGLPLAVRICAARLATRPRWPVATMAARLRDERRRLDELQIGDLEVRASFQVSYDALRGARHQADPARAFRLLGLWQGQQVSLPAAAALAGEREGDLAGALEALVDANLLESPEPDWYQLHDLLRLFAADRAQAEETPEARAGAVTRLLRWYLAAATAAADLLSPYRYRIPGDEPPPPGPPPGSAHDALAWYDHEHANLIAVIRQAAAAGLHETAWRLPVALFELFARRGNWADCITAHRIAADTAHASGSRLGKAWALHNLGWALAGAGDAEAFSCLQEAFFIRQVMNDPDGQAQAALAMSEAHYKIDGPQAAYDKWPRCVEVLRKAGNPHILAAGLNNHGEHCLELGKLDEATECLQEALGIFTAIGSGHGQGSALENLGRVHLESGHFPQAITYLSQAYQILLIQGYLRAQAEALKELGEAQRGAGQPHQARESLEAALALYQDLKDATHVQDIRSALATLAPPARRIKGP